MSYLDYAWARAQLAGWSDSELSRQVQATTKRDPPFYGVADSSNAAKLRAAWPDVWDECQARYDAPGAVLPSDPAGLREKVLA